MTGGVTGGEGAFAQATGRTADAEEAGADKPRYRRYQYDLIAPHCGGSMLEVGAGLGEFAALFGDRERLVVTDVDPAAVRILHGRFAGWAAAEIRQFDLGAGAVLDRPVGTAVAINVLEHFQDDAAVLALLARSVTPGGKIVLWVPAYQSLYGDFDRRVGHFRRYTPAGVRAAAARAGLTTELARPVNLLGGLAWWAAVRLGRTTTPSQGKVSLYDRYLVPTTRLADRARLPFGQSVLAVLQVPP